MVTGGGRGAACPVAPGGETGADEGGDDIVDDEEEVVGGVESLLVPVQKFRFYSS